MFTITYGVKKLYATYRNDVLKFKISDIANERVENTAYLHVRHFKALNKYFVFCRYQRTELAS